MTVDLDVAIVGAGPAGAAAASLLARQGYHVGLIDKATFPRDKACAEYMSPAIEGVLKRLGVLERVEAARPAHLRGFDIYTPAGRAFRADFAGVTGSNGKPYYEYGLALPRHTFDHLLVEQARGRGVEVLEGTRLQDFQVERVGSRQVAAWVRLWGQRRSSFTCGACPTRTTGWRTTWPCCQTASRWPSNTISPWQSKPFPLEAVTRSAAPAAPSNKTIAATSRSTPNSWPCTDNSQPHWKPTGSGKTSASRSARRDAGPAWSCRWTRGR